MKNLLYPHYENGRYYNWDRKNYHHYWQMIKMGVNQCIRYPIQTIHAYRRKSLANNNNDTFLYGAPNSSGAPVITWVGHSTFLIQVGGINILTDPVFDELPFPFPKRLVGSVAAISGLPPVDIVLISHYHADHCDIKTLNNIFAYYKPYFLVPLHCRHYFLSSMQDFVHEKNWWETFGYQQVTFTFLPAYHWSGNSWQTINRSLWGSWMISYQQHAIYFAGDTAYNIHFKYIADQFPLIDVALMPFSACNVQREYKQMLHLTPEEFLLACRDLGAREIIPMHWGTFSFHYDRLRSHKILQEYWQKQYYHLKFIFEGESYIIKKD